MLVEFIFLAVMARLAAGKDLTFKVQNTRSNKLAFRPKLSFHLRTYQIQKRALKKVRTFFQNG